MESFGRRLREERLRRNLDLCLIAEQTRIGKRYLEAIEKDALDELPGGHFRRAFVKQYATALGIPDTEIDEALRGLTGEPPPELLVQALQALPERPKRGLEWRAVAALTAMSVVVAGAVAGGWVLWKALRTARPVEQPRVHTTAAAPQQEAVKQAPAPEVRSSGLLLDLSASEQTWVSVTSAGKLVFSGLLEAGQKRTVEGAARARLLVGNAGGLAVRWNGRPIETIGPRGSIRVVLFTPGSYRIEEWRKPES